MNSESPNPAHLRIATFNVHADDENNNKETRTQLIKDIGADVYLLQEATSESFSEINTNQFEYHFECSKGRHYGQAIGYTRRFKSVEISTFYLPGLGYEGYKSFLVMEYGLYVFACIHLDVHDKTGKTRVNQIQYILEVLEKYKNRPIILGGDFNANIQSNYKNLQTNKNGKSFLRTDIAQKYPLDFVTIQTLKNSKLFSNSFEFVNREPIMTSIYGSRVDFIFTSPEVTISDTNAKEFNFSTIPYPSDHFPVYIDIPLVVDFRDLTILNQNVKQNMGGTNPKALVEFKTKTYVLKYSRSDSHQETMETLNRSINEVLTGKLYQLFGIKVPNLLLLNATLKDGKYHVLSEMMDNYVDLTMIKNKEIRGDLRNKLETDKLYQTQITAGFFIDILLSNWDICGMNVNEYKEYQYANIGIVGPNIKERINDTPFIPDPLDEIVRIDVGAGLLYRAQGQKKTKNAFGAVPKEKFLDAEQAAQPSKLFKYIGRNFWKMSLEHLNKVSEERIIETVDLYSHYLTEVHPSFSETFEDLKYIKQTLVNRLGYLREYYRNYFTNEGNTTSHTSTPLLYNNGNGNSLGAQIGNVVAEPNFQLEVDIDNIEIYTNVTHRIVFRMPVKYRDHMREQAEFPNGRLRKTLFFLDKKSLDLKTPIYEGEPDWDVGAMGEPVMHLARHACAVGIWDTVNKCFKFDSDSQFLMRNDCRSMVGSIAGVGIPITANFLSRTYAPFVVLPKVDWNPSTGTYNKEYHRVINECFGSYINHLIETPLDDIIDGRFIKFNMMTERDKFVVTDILALTSESWDLGIGAGDVLYNHWDAISYNNIRKGLTILGYNQQTWNNEIILDYILRKAFLYDKYASKLKNSGYTNINQIAQGFDNVVAKMKMTDKEKRVFLKHIAMNYKMLSTKSQLDFSRKNGEEKTTLTEYQTKHAESEPYDYDARIHRLPGHFDLDVHTLLEKTIGNIIDIPGWKPGPISIFSDYYKVMTEHKNISLNFFRELFSGFVRAKNCDAIVAIQFALALYTSPYSNFRAVKYALFKKYMNGIEMSSRNKNAHTILQEPIGDLFLRCSKCDTMVVRWDGKKTSSKRFNCQCRQNENLDNYFSDNSSSDQSIPLPVNPDDHQYHKSPFQETCDAYERYLTEENKRSPFNEAGHYLTHDKFKGICTEALRRAQETNYILVDFTKISDIFIILYQKWHEYLKKQKLSYTNILLLSNSQYATQKHSSTAKNNHRSEFNGNQRVDLKIKTLESCTYSFENIVFKTHFGNNLRIFITPLIYGINIENLSAVPSEKEVLLFSPFTNYKLYQLGTRVIESTENGKVLETSSNTMLAIMRYDDISTKVRGIHKKTRDNLLSSNKLLHNEENEENEENELPSSRMTELKSLNNLINRTTKKRFSNEQPILRRRPFHYNRGGIVQKYKQDEQKQWNSVGPLSASIMSVSARKESVNTGKQKELHGNLQKKLLYNEQEQVPSRRMTKLTKLNKKTSRENLIRSTYKTEATSLSRSVGMNTEIKRDKAFIKFMADLRITQAYAWPRLTYEKLYAERNDGIEDRDSLLSHARPRWSTLQRQMEGFADLPNDEKEDISRRKHIERLQDIMSVLETKKKSPHREKMYRGQLLHHSINCSDMGATRSVGTSRNFSCSYCGYYICSKCAEEPPSIEGVGYVAGSGKRFYSLEKTKRPGTHKTKTRARAPDINTDATVCIPCHKYLTDMDTAIATRGNETYFSAGGRKISKKKTVPKSTKKKTVPKSTKKKTVPKSTKKKTVPKSTKKKTVPKSTKKKTVPKSTKRKLFPNPLKRKLFPNPLKRKLFPNPLKRKLFPNPLKRKLFPNPLKRKLFPNPLKRKLL